MSREELERVITEIVNICACTDCSVSRIHKDALEVIERLLADEREKVREMCAKKVEEGIGDYGHIAKAIRQLDLTKLDEG